MRLKQHLVLLLLLLAGNHLFCQDTARNQVALLLSPALVPVSNTGIALQPGVQLRLHHWSLLAQIAFPLHKPHLNYSSIQYFRQSMEVKRYFKQRKDVEGYLSAEVMYAKRNFTDTNGGTYFKSDRVPANRYHYHRAYINTPILTGVINAGMEFTVSKNFFLDGFIGLGVRTIYTKYSRVEGEESDPYGLFEISLPKSAYRYDMTMTKPHISGGLRIAYVLR